MRLPLVPLLIFILLSVGIDAYIYRQLRRAGRKVLSIVYATVSAAVIVMAVVAMNLPFRSGDNTILLDVMWMLFAYLSVYIPKFIYILFSFISRIPALFHHRPLRWLSVFGIVLAAIVFLSLWWGALFNRYRIDVREVEVEVAGLPDDFDGYRIAQFSDFHVGTYGSDTTFVARVVDRINSCGPDLIVFTGDIVNSVSAELRPHTAPLSRLTAPDGVFSILGNHDYGDYSVWSSPAAKAVNLVQLDSMQRAMGWKLLRNETKMIHHAGDSIALIGVENIGDPPFKIYGSLPKSYPSLSDNVTKILLSHNPAHWTDSVADNPQNNIALTLSGHTHAMQMEVAGVSPATLRYPTWGGLYRGHQTDNQLYVNIGLGTVGFPARVGATPEITILTLKKK